MEESIPSAEKQVEIFRSLEKDNKLEPGSYAYLISYNWVEKWKTIVGYNYNEGIDENGSNIGPIDNSSLLFDGKFNNQNSNYAILFKAAWDQLVAWYGGGPEVKVPVVMTAYGIKVITKTFPLNIIYDDTTKSIEGCHKYTLASDLKKMALQAFELPEDTISRLIDYWQKKYYGIMDDDKTITGNNIKQEQDIILDTKDDENANWKNADLCKKHHSSSSYQFSYGHSGGYRSNDYDYNSGYRNYSYGKADAPGIVGLSNLGNTCFFNSGVQCLLHSVPLMKIFLHSNWETDLNETNPIGMKGNLARIFARLMQSVWSGDHCVISPHELKRVIGEFAPQFSGYGQQDSHELITFMLDGLHEDLNRRIEKPMINTIDGDGTNDEEIAALSWENFKKRNDSVIVDTFYGQFRSKLFCPDCRATTTVFDPYVAVSLPISKQAHVKRKLTFIPFDFSEEYKYLTITVRNNASFEDVSNEVSKIIGRNVHVVVGFKGYQSSVNWAIEGDHSYYHTPTYYAFEVPDNYQDQFFIPCVIQMNVAGYCYQQTQDVAGPVLIPVPSVNADEKDIANSASDILKAIWEPSDKPLHRNHEEILKKFELPEEIDDKDCRFKATVSRSYYEQSELLKADKAHPFLCTKIATLQFNPDFVDPKTGFNYASLLRHYREDDSSSDDDNDHQSIDLSNCFQFFTAPDKLDEDNQWFCPKCGQFVCADKKMDIWKVPKCLIIHLKRFISSGYNTKKDETFVSFPEVLDLKNQVIGNQIREENLLYRLYAVSEHSGVLGGGHYTAHAKVVKLNNLNRNGSWYSFNDSSTSASSFASTQSAEAYLLFYQRVSPDDLIVDEQINENENENENRNDDQSDSDSSDSSDSSNNIINIRDSDHNNNSNNNDDDDSDDGDDVSEGIIRIL